MDKREDVNQLNYKIFNILTLTTVTLLKIFNEYILYKKQLYLKPNNALIFIWYNTIGVFQGFKKLYCL